MPKFQPTSICLTLGLLLLTIHPLECGQVSSQYYYKNESNLSRRAANLQTLNDSGETEEMSMEFYKKLDNVSDVSEFIERFVDKDSIDPQIIVPDSIRKYERAASVAAKAANCIPENTIVPLTPETISKDPQILYFPKCTRVKRCNGCCTSKLMSCQPTEIELINFEVGKFHEGKRMRPLGKEIIVVEQHVRCQCGCRIKAEDCNAYQVYRPEWCRCDCVNTEAREKCATQEKKTWDEFTCRCVCPENQNCTTGTYFDDNECVCKNSGLYDGKNPYNVPISDRRRFIVKAIPVETDNSTIYTTV